MALEQGQTTSFKVGLLTASFNFGTSTSQIYKLALYTSTASLGPTTTAYTSTGEVSGSGYTAGGVVLTISQVPTSSGTTAYINFSNAVWSAALTARGGLLYLANGSTNPSVAVLDFGADKTSTITFTVTFPESTVDSALIRLE